jgi:phenylacetate-CoA ligase
VTLEACVFNIAIPAVYRIGRRPQFEILRDLGQRDRWSADRLAEFQLGELRRLVSHAVRTVPYYRELFARIGARAGDIRTLEDYRAIPLLTKDVVREKLHRLCSASTGALLPNATGGSTGKPMRFFQTRSFLDEASAAWFRNFSWTGLPLGCRKFYVWGHPNETRVSRRLKGRLEHWLHRRLFFDAFDMSHVNTGAWAEAVLRHRAVFGYGYASALATFASGLRETGIRIPGMHAIMSTAERLYPHERSLIENVFGCRVFDQYGSREIWSIASECRQGCMHINSDLHLVEFVQLDGPTTNLVVTPLHNYGMPMLRYLNEDLGAPLSGTCTCGLSYPTMTAVQGRTSDNFKTPDGRIVHGEYLTHLMYNVDGIGQFQFVQRALRDVTLSLVRSPRFNSDTEAQLRRVQQEFAQYFGLPLKTQYVPQIAPTASGKQRFTISFVPGRPGRGAQ